MTEADWLTGTDPQAMLRALEVLGPRCRGEAGANRASDRKLRLFVEACERLCTCKEGRTDYDAQRWAGMLNVQGCPCTKSARAALLRCIFGNPFQWRHTIGPESWLAWNDGTVVKIAQAIYDGREPCGNPECPAPRQTEGWTCAQCQGTGFVQRDRWGDLPILADALEEAGCEDEDILAHCRGRQRCSVCLAGDAALEWEYYEPGLGPPGCHACDGTGWRAVDATHARGCWVIDLLLGKE